MATAIVDRSICFACRVIHDKFEIDIRVICACGHIMCLPCRKARVYCLCGVYIGSKYCTS